MGCRKIRSHANIKRLKKVAGALQGHEQASMFQQVIDHMKANPEDVRPLFQLCESGLVQTLSTEEFQPMVPSCSSNLKLVSLTLKKAVLKNLNPGIDATLLKQLRKVDINIVDTLFFFCVVEDPKTGVEPNLSEEQFIQNMKERHSVCGARAAQLEFKQDKVEWPSCGVYRLCGPPEGEPESVEGTASWVEHRPSTFKALS
eukprot:13296478-Heterocapsa_arctica.AAC.1